MWHSPLKCPAPANPKWMACTWSAQYYYKRALGANWSYQPFRRALRLQQRLKPQPRKKKTRVAWRSPCQSPAHSRLLVLGPCLSRPSWNLPLPFIPAHPPLLLASALAHLVIRCFASTAAHLFPLGSFPFFYASF